MTLASDVVPIDPAEPQRPPPAPTPLLLCRHYVKNYVDLFQDLIRRVYLAGNVDSPVHVRPGMTVGSALDVTEQQAAAALAVDDGENLLLGLIRTMLDDSDVAAADVEVLMDRLQEILTGPSTFAEKADAIESALSLTNLTDSQVEQTAGAFRSMGQVISDVLAFAFPALSNYRIDFEGDVYLLIDGPYTAVLSADPAEVLTCVSSERADDLELSIAIDSFEIAEQARFRLMGVSDFVQPLLDTAMKSVGTVRLDGIAITLELDDQLALPDIEYTSAPGHTALRAEWTQATARIHVDDVSLDLETSMASIIVGLAACTPAAAVLVAQTVGNLEEEWGDLIRDTINSLGDVAGLAAIVNAYVMPIARRVIPICHALSDVRYSAPFEVEGAVSYQRFDGLETVYAARSVGIMNPKPPHPDKPAGTSDDLPDPPDRDDLPNLGGVQGWRWPARTAGTPRPHPDLTDPDHRATAVGLLAGIHSLSARTKAIAALDVEGFSARTISVLKPADVAHGRIAGRPVGGGTLALLERGALGTDYLFRAGGFPGRTPQVRREIEHAMRTVADTPPIDDPEEAPADVILPDIDPGIWTMDHAAESPLSKSRGNGSDPGWIGLSTNCVVATQLYRKLHAQGVLTGAGVTHDDAVGRVAYEVRGCADIAADFTGGSSGGPIAIDLQGPPAVVLAGLVVAVGRELTPYVVDVRLLLRPVIYPRGCLPDASVTAVFDAHDCLQTMTGGTFSDSVWAQQVAYRDFVFLSADLESRTSILLLKIVEQANGEPATDTAVQGRVRAASRIGSRSCPRFRSSTTASARSAARRGTSTPTTAGCGSTAATPSQISSAEPNLGNEFTGRPACRAPEGTPVRTRDSGLVLTNSIHRTPRPLGGAQRARRRRESAVRRFRQDPHVPADQILADYDQWLQRQALAARTRASYRRWVHQLLVHLDAGNELEGFLARNGEHDRRAVLGDWRRRLVDRRLAPSTVNLALAAATSLLDSRALPTPRVPRVEIDPAPPRALTREQLRAVERETDRLRSSRDRAIMTLLLRTGLRIGELADLDASDVRLTQRTGELVIRHGKGDRRRVVPLNRSARAALRPWLSDRQDHATAPARDHGPLWISRTGERLSVRSITKLVTRVMAAAGVEETAHGLRHTLATRLVRDHGRDLALVADVLGHADVKTTRRYARSELDERRAALEALDR